MYLIVRNRRVLQCSMGLKILETNTSFTEADNAFVSLDPFVDALMERSPHL